MHFLLWPKRFSTKHKSSPKASHVPITMGKPASRWAANWCHACRTIWMIYHFFSSKTDQMVSMIQVHVWAPSNLLWNIINWISYSLIGWAMSLCLPPPPDYWMAHLPSRAVMQRQTMCRVFSIKECGNKCVRIQVGIKNTIISVLIQLSQKQIQLENHQTECKTGKKLT